MRRTSCKQLTKTFGSKRPALEFNNSCALLSKFDTSELHLSSFCIFRPLLLHVQVDLVRHKRLLLETVDSITGVLDTTEEKGPQAVEEEALQEADSKGLLPSFDEVFMVSALSGDGVEAVKVTTNSCIYVY